jgi:hypothetical protein
LHVMRKPYERYDSLGHLSMNRASISLRHRSADTPDVVRPGLLKKEEELSVRT